MQRVRHGVDGGIHAVDHALAGECEDAVEGLGGVQTGVTLLVAVGPSAAPVERGPAELGAAHTELAEARDGHALGGDAQEGASALQLGEVVQDRVDGPGLGGDPHGAREVLAQHLAEEVVQG